MRIRNRHRSPPFVFTCSDPPRSAAVEEASFPETLISNTLGMKLFTESVNPTQAVPNHHHQYSESQSKIISLAANTAGVRKPNDNADDSSYFAELRQIPPLPAIPDKEAEEEIEKFRVCTLNKSPWDVPSFVQAFLMKPTTEPVDDQSMQNSRWKRERNNNQKEMSTRPLVPKQWKVKAMAEAKQQADMEDDNDFNKTEIASCERCLTLPCGKDELQIVKEEEQTLESALVRVFSEEVAGLTVREAGCKLNMLGNVNNIISAGLPLSVQVRRAMINSPCFVQMDDGKFALWDNFLNTTVGRLDEEEITGSGLEKEMGIHKLNREEDCATYKGPAKELGHLVETNLELAVPKLMRTKGKRSRRAGLGLDMRKEEEKEEIGICKQTDGKRRKSCGQAVEQRSYNSACGILYRRNKALHSRNNSSTVQCNNSSWTKDAVDASDSQCYYPQSISDGNGRKPHKNGVPLQYDIDRDRAGASCLISCMNGNIGKKELPPAPCYRKKKPVKARSLNALL